MQSSLFQINFKNTLNRYCIYIYIFCILMTFNDTQSKKLNKKDKKNTSNIFYLIKTQQLCLIMQNNSKILLHAFVVLN